MAEDRKHYVLKAETGHFRVVVGSANLIANTAIIALESLSAPAEASVITPALPIMPQEPKSSDSMMHWRTTDGAHDASKDPNAIVISRHFKLVFISVLAITTLAGLAQIIMAGIWGTPTGLQQEVFSAMGFAWKVGFGAIVGLLGGKLT